MSRTLLVMRHAKSSWKAGLSDPERPLNARGRRDAPRMALLLASEGLIPEHVLCSDAERTRETLVWMEDALERSLPQTLLARLYHAGLGDLLDAIADGPDVERLLILGHNPGLETLLEHLTGEQVVMPTAAVAVLDVPADTPWRDVPGLAGRMALRTVFRPRDLSAQAD